MIDRSRRNRHRWFFERCLLFLLLLMLQFLIKLLLLVLLMLLLMLLLLFQRSEFVGLVHRTKRVKPIVCGAAKV